MIANYHTHTTRCHHADGTEREYIEKAIREGLSVLGFSDHVPMPFPDGHQSGFRVRIEELEDYINTLHALREEYRGRIEILIGFEAEYYPARFEDMLALLSKYDYDYLIMGQHFINNEDGEQYNAAPTQDEHKLTRYVEQVLEGLRTGKFTYLAHPDLLNYRGDDTVYEREIRKLCLGCLEMNIPLEINLLGVKEHRSYPREDFLRIAAEVGNTFVLGCDAHHCDDVANPDQIAEALALAGKFGLTVVNTVTIRNPKE